MMVIEMEYDKLGLDIEQQVQLLLDRGMVGDPNDMARKLSLVGYYRLSAYWRIFRREDGDTCSFIKGTHFIDVWDIYVSDRKLRLLMMDAIERIEIAVRSQIANHHSISYGPFGYAVEPDSLSCSPYERLDVLRHIRENVNGSSTEFIKNFRLRYGDFHDLPPIWMAVEVITLGNLVALYRTMPSKIQKSISSEYDVSDQVFSSWLFCLRWTRNACAHHARLWNVNLPVKPMIPRYYHNPQWHDPEPVPNSKSICHFGDM